MLRTSAFFLFLVDSFLFILYPRLAEFALSDSIYYEFDDKQIAAKNFHILSKQSKNSLTFTYPGTKWCGPGFTANSYWDLGRLKETDKCCRAHDMCPKSLAANQKKYGLWNYSMFTRSHCSCDEKLRRCLKSVNTCFSRNIGRMYFKFVPFCFMKSHVITRCTRKVRRRCVKYIINKNSKRVYQWFDNPRF